MPRANQTKSKKEDSGISAARISRKGAIIAALLTLLGTIIAATIANGWWGKWFTPQPKQLTVRVKDEVTRNGIPRAKVRLEVEDTTLEQPTDAYGAAYFSILDASKRVLIAVEAEDYNKPDERKVVPPTVSWEIEIPLRRLKSLPGSNTTQASTQISPQAQSPRNKQMVSQYVVACRNLYDKAESEAALFQCNKALEIDPKNPEATELKNKIKASIRTVGK